MVLEKVIEKFHKHCLVCDKADKVMNYELVIETLFCSPERYTFLHHPGIQMSPTLV